MKTKKTISPLSLEAIVTGAEKTFENAEQLYHEAELLAGVGAVARALCLHQISLEECSKVNNLGVMGTSLITEPGLDQTKALRSFSQHSAKNKSNAYMLEASGDEDAAAAEGDVAGALSAFRRMQDQFHQTSNDAKNASLYVDLVDGQFSSPGERITVDMLQATRERNAKYLGYAHNSLVMLQGLLRDPDRMRIISEKLMAELNVSGAGAFPEMSTLLEKIVALAREAASEQLVSAASLPK